MTPHIVSASNPVRSTFFLRAAKRLHIAGSALADQIAAWIFDVDLDTVEKFTIVKQFAAALAVLVFPRALAGDPTVMGDSYILVLPVMLWSPLFMLAGMLQLSGRRKKNLCCRRNASFFGFAMLLMLIGPLWLRGPGLAVMMGALILFQCVLAAKLFKMCREARCSGDE